MPLQKVLFKSGVNRENTRYTNEGGWFESDKVRFRQGTPEKIGGWTRFSVNQFLGVCRSLWNWVTLAGQNLVSAGTDKKFYINQGGYFFDITPIRSTAVLTNPFSVTTVGTSTVRVADTAHGCVLGSYVTFSGAGIVGLGGNITAAKLTGEFVVASIIDDNTYTITVAAVSNATDVSGSPGGGTVVTQYQVNIGPATQAPLVGWGAGAWGTGAWGVGTAESNPLQLWNARNFGQDLIYGARGQGVYYWNAEKAVEPVQVTISIATPGVITMPAGYSLPNGTLVQFESSGALPTGLVVGDTYFVVSSSGINFSVSATIAGSPITTSGGQSGLQYISQRGVNIYGVEDVNAPILHNYLLVSDSSRFVILFGSNEFENEAIDPMLIRWSDQESPFVWTPAATNQAGSIRLSLGSQIIAAVQTRQEIVVLTDQAVYSMQYLGPPFVWGIQPLGDNISVAGPNATALASGVVYWMGVDKFYMYDGRLQTLSCDLLRFVFTNFNKQQNQQVFAGTNEGFNEVWWFYCSAESTVVDRYVIFNYLEKVWYYGALQRSAWLDSGLLPFPIAATYSNNIVNQEDGVDDAETYGQLPIEAYISSSEFDIGDGHNFGFIWRMLPDITFNGSSTSAVDAAQVQMTLYPMQNAGSGTGTAVGASVTSGGSTYTVTEEFTGQIYTRVRGRQMIFKVASTRAGTTWQLGAPRLDIRQDGRR